MYLYTISSADDVPLSVAKKQTNCPRFYTQRLYLDEGLSTERCLEAINCVEQGKIICKNTKFHLTDFSSQPNMRLLIRLFEVVNPSSLGCSFFHQMLSFMPIMQKVTNFSCIDIDDVHLLNLNAPNISILRGGIRTRTLNRFLKQWFKKYRVIEEFTFMYKDEEKHWSEMDHRKILSGIPFERPWSVETHESSALSHLDVEEVNAIFEHHSYYLLNNGENMLFVHFIIDGRFFRMDAKAVLNPIKEIQNEFEGQSEG